MRVDRLLTLLMLLQTRGRMTAERLSEELEVSARCVLLERFERAEGFDLLLF